VGYLLKNFSAGLISEPRIWPAVWYPTNIFDHCKAAKDLIKAGVDIYVSQETIDALGLAGHRAQAIKAKEQFTLGTWTVISFTLEHDVPNLGFLLASGDEKLAYITDSAYCRFKFSGLTHLMVEANYSMPILRENVASGAVPVEMKNRLLRSHMSVETALEMIRTNDNSRLKEIHLIHLSDGNSNAEEFKRRAQECTGKPVYVAGK